MSAICESFLTASTLLNFRLYVLRHHVKAAWHVAPQDRIKLHWQRMWELTFTLTGAVRGRFSIPYGAFLIHVTKPNIYTLTSILFRNFLPFLEYFRFGKSPQNSSEWEDQKKSEFEVFCWMYLSAYIISAFFFFWQGFDVFKPSVVDGSLSGMCAVISSWTGFKSVGLFQH